MKGRVQKKKKNYYVVLELGEEERDQKWISVRKELGLNRPAKKYEADNLLIDKLNEIKNGTYFEPYTATVKEYLDVWIDNYCKQNLCDNTVYQYESFIKNHINPKIGKIKLSKLRPGHVQAMLTEKKGSLKESTISIIFKMLKHALKVAVQWEYLNRNICDAVIPPSPKKEKPVTWSREQAKQFLSKTKEHRLYTLFLLALSTGMRRGEILGLRWNDIDFNRQCLEIKQTLITGEKGKSIIGTPKADSDRVIDLSPKILNELKQHRKRQQEFYMIIGRPEADNNHVFTNEAGKPVIPANLWRTFNYLIRRAKLPNIRFHDLRHCHASLLLEDGVHIKVVSERLGHKSVNITLDTYSHITPRLSKEAAKATDNLLE